MEKEKFRSMLNKREKKARVPNISGIFFVEQEKLTVLRSSHTQQHHKHLIQSLFISQQRQPQQHPKR